MYLREQGREDPWLFFEGKRVREQKSLGNTGLDHGSHGKGPRPLQWAGSRATSEI
jgi:hypothetical protein